MKRRKGIKIILCLAVLILTVVSAFIYNNYTYSSNQKIIDYYNNNKEILNEYIAVFDKDSFKKNTDGYFNDEVITDTLDDTRLLYEVPDCLSKAEINSIEYYNDCLFFEFPATGDYYNAVYYSKDRKPSEDCPIYTNESEKEDYKFRHVGKGIYISGKKNNGIDWYKTEQIESNWYYYEVHLS